MIPRTLTGNLKEEYAGALTEGRDKDDQLRLEHSMDLYPWCHSSRLDLRSAQDHIWPFCSPLDYKGPDLDLINIILIDLPSQ